MSGPLVREVIDRGATAAVMPYDPENQSILLIVQFRPGAWAGGGKPWLLEIVAGATEFERHAARPGEASALRHVLNHSPVTLESRRTTDPHVKTAALLQAHFGRMQLNGDLKTDLA